MVHTVSYGPCLFNLSLISLFLLHHEISLQVAAFNYENQGEFEVQLESLGCMNHTLQVNCVILVGKVDVTKSALSTLI